MNPKQLLNAYVDDQGRLVLPPELTTRFGLQPGSQIQIETGPDEFHVLRPLAQLAKVYVEPTDICNLDCVTCIRNVWDEPAGLMSAATFGRVLDGLAQIEPRPAVFFGGFGEPLAHPQIVEMVAQAKALGCPTELITNGILLDERRLLGLIRAGLDRLWVSLDGATPESYADVRLGASLPQVITNLRRLRQLRGRDSFQHDPRPQLGIAFVAMQRNIADLPAVLRLGASLGAKFFSVSNVLAHTPALHAERLYTRTQDNHATWRDTQQAVVNLPRLDTNSATQVPLAEIYARRYVLELAGKPVNRAIDSCPFIEQGSTAVRWDGAVCPCLPLLHTGRSYLGGYVHTSQAHPVGDLAEDDLLSIWNGTGYAALRERVRFFSFSPCTSCTGCELSRDNQEDCLGNPAPTCGGCLWGQGLIQCP